MFGISDVLETFNKENYEKDFFPLYYLQEKNISEEDIREEREISIDNYLFLPSFQYFLYLLKEKEKYIYESINRDGKNSVYFETEEFNIVLEGINKALKYLGMKYKSLKDIVINSFIMFSKNYSGVLISDKKLYKELKEDSDIIKILKRSLKLKVYPSSFIYYDGLIHILEYFDSYRNQNMIDMYEELKEYNDSFETKKYDRVKMFTYYYILFRLFKNEENIRYNLKDYDIKERNIRGRLLDEINELNIFYEIKKFENKKELLTFILNKSGIELKEVLQYVRKKLITDVYNIQSLYKKGNFDYSDILIRSAEMTFSIRNKNNEFITEREIKDIFNNMIESREIPYIKYTNLNNKDIIKTYDERLESKNPLDYIPEKNKLEKEGELNYISFSLWMRSIDVENKQLNFVKATIGKFSYGYIYYRNGKVILDVPYKKENKNNILDAITLSLQDYNLHKEESDKMKADVYMFKKGYTFNMKDYIFLDYLLDWDKLYMNIFKYVEYEDKTYFNSKDLSIDYILPLNNDFNIINMLSPSKEYVFRNVNIKIKISVFTLEPGQSLLNKKFNEKINYIHVNFFNYDDAINKESFLKSLSSILFRYFIYDQEDEELNDYYLDYKDIFTKKEKKYYEPIPLSQQKSGITKKITNIEKLKLKHPGVFPKNYKFSKNQIPKTFYDKNELNKWLSKNKIKGKRRKYMVYPNKDDINKVDYNKFYFVCPNDTYSYPFLKEHNKTLTNPLDYLPDCSKVEQKGLRKKKYGRNEKSTSYILKSNKILEYGGMGNIQADIKILLDNNNLIRYSTNHTTSSFLEAVFLGVKDKIYKETNNKIRFLEKYRTKFNFKKEHINLLKQELYDFKDEDIINMFKDLDNSIDSSLYYRLLEEIFEINIFVFIFKRELNKIYIEEPRNKEFHSRRYTPEKDTILIYKHWGLKSDNVLYPQYDLIKSNKRNSFIFNKNTFERCYDILFSSHESKTSVMYHDYDTYGKNLILSNYYNINFPIIKPYSQKIDSNGKCRALTYKYENRMVSILIPPTQPYFLKTGNIYDTYEEDVINLLQLNPTFKTSDSYGLWFNIGENPQGVFVNLKEKTQGIYNTTERALKFYEEEDESEVERINKMRGDINFINNIIIWLISLFKRKLVREIDDFVNYIIQEETEYDFSGLERMFPLVEKFDDALLYLEGTGFVRNFKIIAYNEIFYEKLINLVYSKYRKTIIIPYEIKGYYDYNGYKMNKNTKIFIGNSIEYWIYEQKIKKNNLDCIATIITKKHLELINPFIYFDEKRNNYFIVQNTFSNDISIALNYCKNWYDKEINEYTNIKMNKLEHILFILDKEGNLKIYKNKSSTNSYLMILLTKNDDIEIYSSLLPIYLD